MNAVHITKETAAQRQLDMAIRLLFVGEDILGIHTVAAAARRVLSDLCEQREPSAQRVWYESALRDLHKKMRMPENISAEGLTRELPGFKKWYRNMRNRSANFLKHADNDSRASLDLDNLDTDHEILEACATYLVLGFELTPEMRTFTRWHLAVYSHESGDAITTAAGEVQSLPRHHQLEFGGFLVELMRGGDS